MTTSTERWSPGSTAARKFPWRRSALLDVTKPIAPRTPTAGEVSRRSSSSHRKPRRLVTVKSAYAARRCYWATFIPKTMSNPIDAAGFFRTGDLGRWIDDEYLVVTGRAKDVIIRNGENISAKEVEDLLAEHPGIAEIAVVGLPDERTGERACAVIVPAGTPGPDVASLVALLQSKGVAKFKAPEQVVVWDALPKNDAGKILKHQIRAALTEVDD